MSRTITPLILLVALASAARGQSLVETLIDSGAEHNDWFGYVGVEGAIGCSAGTVSR